MPKLLGEFLEEQQEPFALDIYLVERGCSSSGFRNNTQFFKGSPASCTEFAKAVFSRVILHINHDKQKIKSPGNGGPKDTNNWKSIQGEYAVFSSCSEKKVDADRKLEWRSNMEDSSNRQLSPVSVLEEIESDNDGSSPLVHHKNYYFKKTTQGEYPSTSTSQCKSKQPTYINSAKFKELVGTNSYDQYIINKRALHETKQLLIDCVREVIEKHMKRDDKKGEQLKRILGTDELWKLVCENVWLWSQHSIHETNTLHLLNYDFMACAQEWSSHFELQKEEISMEIGDAILDGIISDIFTS